jgi:hypothetical protein
MVVATLVTMLAATLGLPAPASAAPAAAAAVRCWPESGPASYSGHGGVQGWGRFDCSASVAWIDITVSMERDGVEVYHKNFHATRRPGNGLFNVLLIFGAACVTGSYRITTTGSAAGHPYSGVTGPPDYITCGPVFPV